MRHPRENTDSCIHTVHIGGYRKFGPGGQDHLGAPWRVVLGARCEVDVPILWSPLSVGAPSNHRGGHGPSGPPGRSAYGSLRTMKQEDNTFGSNCLSVHSRSHHTGGSHSNRRCHLCRRHYPSSVLCIFFVLQQLSEHWQRNKHWDLQHCIVHHK